MCEILVVTLPLVLCVLQHYKQPELYATILHYMNTTFTGLFSIECMMKIHAYGFRVSTQGKLKMQVAFNRPRVAILWSILIFNFSHELPTLLKTLAVQATARCALIHQWLRQIYMKLPYAVWRKSALKFTKVRKRENLISYYFLLFWFHKNSKILY